MELLQRLFLWMAYMMGLDQSDAKFQENYDKAMNGLPEIVRQEKNKKSFDGELEPPFPDLKEDRKTLHGIDSNHNDVRDDVEIWINRNFDQYNHRMAVKSYVKALKHSQNIGLKRNSSTFEEVKQAYFKIEYAMYCMGILSRYKMSENWRERYFHSLDKVYFNTKERDAAQGWFTARYNPPKRGEEDIQRMVNQNLNDVEKVDLCTFSVQERKEIDQLYYDYMKKRYSNNECLNS